MIIEWIVGFFILTYCLFIMYLWFGWERITIISDKDFLPSVAIIIAVRNEAENIGMLIANIADQSYQGKIELIVVNDHSEDETREIVWNAFDTKSNCKLIDLKIRKGKKAAITEGLLNTNSEIIITTDGDCNVPKRWVEAMIGAFTKTTQLVSGPVVFQKENNFFNQIQAMEFVSLIASGASLIGWGKPVMSNGANLAFRHSAFIAVNGFEGNLNTASGDDVFLLHKIAAQYPNSIAFAKSEDAIVKTKSQTSISLFLQQRIRWASKWKAYTDVFTQSTAILVFLISLILVVMPVLVLNQKISIYTWANLLIIKSFFDYFFLKQVSNHLKVEMNLAVFIFIQLIYPLYVVLAALFSFKKSYYWKGRRVK